MRRLAALTIAAVLLAAAGASAQSYYAKETALYAEFFGSGGELSANFEKIVGERIAFRVGFGLTGAVFKKGWVAPFGLSWMLGGDRNFLEVGVGGSYVDFDAGDRSNDPYLDVAEDQLVGTGMIGYRFVGHYGFVYRLAFTPALTKDGFQPMGGAALGYAF